MLASYSRIAARGCQRTVSEVIPKVGSSSQTFLKTRSQQQCRNSHVRGLKRPTRASVAEDALDSWDLSPEHILPTSSSFNPGLANANKQLAYLDEKHAASLAMETCQKMKESNIAPDSTTYSHLLSLCAHHHAPMEAWAILEDMAAVGIIPDRAAFHDVMRAMEARELRGTWQLLQVMQQLNIEPDAKTFDIIITRTLDSDNVELALQYLALMSTRALVPLVNTAENLVRAVCGIHLPRLALDLARSFEQVSVRRLGGDVWMDCLIASAETLYIDGVRDTWKKCIHELNIIPDEGCCLQVLNAAARAGDAQLALDVIRTLQSMRITWEEHHFAPLVEAFSRTSELKQALEVLTTMSSHEVTPNAGTAQPIYHAIAGSATGLDKVWEAIDSLHASGKVVHPLALNVAVRAAVRVDDLQRALGIYKAYPDFNATPNVDTFNYLLLGCIRASHRPLGDRLMSEMKELGIKPNGDTYERLISLCLTQATYEDAFFYLEELKTEGFIPSREVYQRIIRKCVTMGDPRYKIALEELEAMGYEISQELQAFVESGGQRPARAVSDSYTSNRTRAPPRSRNVEATVLA
ncbi:hypothetical protein BXZ70DRAFT_913562 [Cristinia sonorae]|uniref:Pentatricopeptide repeat-containing protein-mitochondrial domain-containing protein n=1 Tax=Cristinia sonorae TaxID=1940300 RepID=A0A8K0V0A0_9AGAR|nr:hypothetical protein BXZ70DRAFT_913562 [Cristinia sonorae]